MSKFTEMETFAISDHRSSTYSNILDPSIDLPEDITFYSTRASSRKKWLIIIVGIFLLFLIYSAFYFQEPNHTNKSSQPAKSAEIVTHKNCSECSRSALSVVDKPDYVYNHAQTYFDGSMTYLVEPSHYDIQIEPFVESSYRGGKQFTFKGKVDIVMQARQELDTLILGAMDLSVEKLALKRIKNYQPFNRGLEITESIQISFDAYDTVNGTLHLELDTPMFPLQTYELQIQYSGHIQEIPYGFFRFYYVDRDNGNITKWVVGTNTETPFARAMFPCFDAPDLETTFKMSIGHNKNTAVISNIEHVQTDTQHDGWIWEMYEAKKKMPLHSLSFGVTNFKNVTKTTKNLQFNVWTSVDKPENSAYILDIGPKLVHSLETYFGLPFITKQINIFGLPQMIPHLRAKIGMIYISESDLTVNENDTSEQQKEQITLSLAYNLIEQFIDSYVVFEWDSEKWIKESLIQYLSYQMTHYIEPTWGILKKFQEDVQQREMEVEVESSIYHSTFLRWKPVKKISHLHYMFPLNETSIFDYNRQTALSIIPSRSGPHINPKIYSQLHDRRSSDKGACVFHMIQQMVSESVFKHSLQKFLKRENQDITVEGADLWKTITEEIRNSSKSYLENNLLSEHITIQSVVEDWIYSDGYPLLTAYRDYQNNTITFRQIPENSEIVSKSSQRLALWHIPITYTTEENLYFGSSLPKYWLNKVREMKAPAPSKLSSDKWLLINPGESAFYRVDYDKKNWELLKKGYIKGHFPEIVRAQLLDDALFLGRKGILDQEFSLDMMNLLIERKEEQYVVWRPIFRHLKYIQEMMREIDNTKEAESNKTSFYFKKYVQKLVSHSYQHLQKKNDERKLSHNEKLLCSEIFLWACAVEYQDCKNEARAQFDQWKNSVNSEEKNLTGIAPDMRYAVLCSVMAEGNKSDYDFLMKQYKKTHGNAPYKYEYLKSLLCYQKPEILEFLLSNTLEKVLTFDHLHDVQHMWTALSETFYDFEDIFTTFVSHWAEIQSKFEDFKPILETILKAVTKNVTTRKELAKMEDFRKSLNNDISHANVLRDAEKILREKLAWKENRLKRFDSWVRKTLESHASEQESKIKSA